MNATETQEEIKHHAEEARRWAISADREGAGHDRDPNAAQARERAMRYSAVSTAHGLAAIATVLGEGYISGEMEMVKFAGSEPVSDPGEEVTDFAQPEPESEPEPEKVCTCGHPSSDHGLAGGGAPAGSFGGCKLCPCIEFRKPSSTQPAVPVDQQKPPAPFPGRASLCTCGHQRQAHKEGGCFYSGGADQATCGCAEFTPVSPPGPPDPPDVPEMVG